MFTLEYLGDLLFYDFMERSRMKEGIEPRLVNLNQIYELNHKYRANDDYFDDEEYVMLYQNSVIKELAPETLRNFEHLPCIRKLLVKYNGNIIVAGGAVQAAVCDGIDYDRDVDLFFVDCDESLINEAIKYTCELISEECEYLIVRNQLSTTILFFDGDTNLTYQFVHRIYPSCASVILGFDLGICACYYDGENIYSTVLGAFSLATQSNIVDVSRRSTSFEHRLIKYYNYNVKIVFPHKQNSSLYFNITENIQVNGNKPNKYHLPSKETDYGAHKKYNEDKINYSNAVAAIKKQVNFICWYGESFESILTPNIMCKVSDHQAMKRFNIDMTYYDCKDEEIKLLIRVIVNKAKSRFENEIKDVLEEARELAAKGITIITKSPMSQGKYENWSSSFYPLSSDPRKFYIKGKKYLRIGISNDICVELKRVFYFYNIPFDIMDHIVELVKIDKCESIYHTLL